MFLLHTQYSGRHKESYTQRFLPFTKRLSTCAFNLFNLSSRLKSNSKRVPVSRSPEFLKCSDNPFKYGMVTATRLSCSSCSLLSICLLRSLFLSGKHHEMGVLNNFDHVETWKPILNSFFVREKDCSRQWIIAKVKVLDRPRTAFPAHFEIIYTSCNDHDTSRAAIKLNN